MNKFVPRKIKDRWIIRSQGALGEAPVGPRLAKGAPFPKEIGLIFEKKSDALRASVLWEEWYQGQPYVKKSEKRKAKYLA